jgi:glyoxylase-like metal-dependent hydrolase (beta-lactamase superfamily II)
MSVATIVKPDVKAFFEERTFSLQYVVSDPASRKCAIIDPVLDYEERSGSTATRSADEILHYVDTNKLEVQWILDTHVHADHLTASHYLKQKTGAATAIGEEVDEIQKFWKDIYNIEDLATDGSQWDRLLKDREKLPLGEAAIETMLSPGHTPASITYIVGEAIFVHDTLFAPDYGTARTDFPGGDAALLWRSIEAILALPEDFRVFTGHDYLPGNRAIRFESTVKEHREKNVHIAPMKSEAEFVAMRKARDKTLAMPKLLLPSVQVNICGGRLPSPEGNGRAYLKIPLDAFPHALWEK